MCLKCKIDTENNFFESYSSYYIYIQDIEIKIKKLDGALQTIVKSYKFTIESKNIKFILNWNKKENTYFLHDLTNKVYETDIITKTINSNNQEIILNNNIIDFLFTNKPTFKCVKESL